MLYSLFVNDTFFSYQPAIISDSVLLLGDTECMKPTWGIIYTDDEIFERYGWNVTRERKRKRAMACSKLNKLLSGKEQPTAYLNKWRKISGIVLECLVRTKINHQICPPTFSAVRLTSSKNRDGRPVMEHIFWHAPPPQKAFSRC